MMLTKVNGWTIETARLLDGGVRCTVTPPAGTAAEVHEDMIRHLPLFEADSWRDLQTSVETDECDDRQVVMLHGFVIAECPTAARAEDVLSRLCDYMSAEVEPLSLVQLEEAVTRAEVEMALPGFMAETPPVATRRPEQLYDLAVVTRVIRIMSHEPDTSMDKALDRARQEIAAGILGFGEGCP